MAIPKKNGEQTPQGRDASPANRLRGENAGVRKKKTEPLVQNRPGSMAEKKHPSDRNEKGQQ